MPSKATLTGAKPFSSFTVPGVSPSVVVDRRGVTLDDEATKALKKALKDGQIPNVTADDVALEPLDAPGVSADTSEDERVGELEAQLAEARRAHDETEAERARLDERVGELEAQLADGDAAAFASGILDSFTVPELAKAAKARGLDVKSDATKADVVAALVAPQGE